MTNSVFIISAVVAAFIILGAVISIIYLKRGRDKSIKQKQGTNHFSISSEVNISVLDIIRLANADYILELNTLISEEEVTPKTSDFYEKLDNLNKRLKDNYFQNLLDVLVAGNEEWMEDRLARSDISVQDILLKLLIELGLDNKTIAQTLLISVETLKKRKTRLNAKWK